jgi:hypothetical protein
MGDKPFFGAYNLVIKRFGNFSCPGHRLQQKCRMEVLVTTCIAATSSGGRKSRKQPL